jgi:tetratricopeptide (TPR) repeat protein
MGIKLPSAKMIPKVSDKQMADAWENENRVVPKKDANRIAAIPKKVNDGNMKGYLAAVQKKTAELFPANTRAAAEKVYNYIKANSNNNGETGNMAFALWIDGRQQLALLVMGKLIAEDPRNTDHLSNYASMLSMMGAQHLAIPILSNLNARFPNNSTLLNNLGQAWFGLGEIEKAEKYLDSAIRIYAYHPQANLTKAAIEESKGDHKKTVEAVKRSIKHSYSTEKEEKLRQLGHTLKTCICRLNPVPIP